MPKKEIRIFLFQALPGNGKFEIENMMADAKPEALGMPGICVRLKR